MVAGLGQAEHEQCATGCQHQQARPVEGAFLCSLCSREHLDGQDDCRDPDRNVDQEKRSPAHAVDEEATRCGAEDRPDEQREAEPAHHLPSVPFIDELQSYRHADRLQETSAESLNRPKGDEALHIPGQTCEGRSCHEDGQCADVHACGTESSDHPCRCRHHGHECESVCGGDPLHGREICVERFGEPGDRDNGHRDVQHHHQGAQRENRRHLLCSSIHDHAAP